MLEPDLGRGHQDGPVVEPLRRREHPVELAERGSQVVGRQERRQDHEPLGAPHVRDVLARHVLARSQDVKSTSLVSTVPAVRPGAVWYFQYRLVCAMTRSGGGAPHSVWSSVVWASLTRVASYPRT